MTYIFVSNLVCGVKCPQGHGLITAVTLFWTSNPSFFYQICRNQLAEQKLLDFIFKNDLKLSSGS